MALFETVRAGSSEQRALRDYIAERRREHFGALAAIHCDPREADVYRGQLLELDRLERELTLPEIPQQ